MSASGRLRPVVTVRDFSWTANCYSQPNGRVRPRAVVVGVVNLSHRMHCNVSLRKSIVELELIGRPPLIEGQRCEGLICEGFECDGELIQTANVTYLRFGGTWHRLCFDPGTVHWRTWPTDPEPWAVDEEGWAYPHVNVALAAELDGVRLKSYRTLATERGASVVFEFENSRKVLINDIDDCTSYEVI
jgi:hypothetical protein